MSPPSPSVLVFAHIGDLHLTDAKQQNFKDYLSIVAQLAVHFEDKLDFVVLPGDNADQGHAAQYALVDVALRMLRVPGYAITGDHDMEQGSLEGFYALEVAEQLPRSVDHAGFRCLFLDMCGPGSGGPDFRLGDAQLAWLERQMRAATEAGQPIVLFMHSYPADLTLTEEAERVNSLIAAYDVALVDIGHTHYNELANDGRTIFAATRSTGQIEEGPVGYSIASIDRGVVSWRFKPLDDGFPFVLITSPADHRLMRSQDHAVEGTCEVRAMVLGQRGILQVACRIGDAATIEMLPTADARIYAASVSVPADSRLLTVTVEARDASGRPGQHIITVATSAYTRRPAIPGGSDAAAVGAWPENGIFATQLGPNRNGKPLF